MFRPPHALSDKMLSDQKEMSLIGEQNLVKIPHENSVCCVVFFCHCSSLVNIQVGGATSTLNRIHCHALKYIEGIDSKPQY